jgi:hypothetical protein
LGIATEDDDGATAQPGPARRAAQAAKAQPDSDRERRMKRMFALLNEHGKGDKAVALAFVSEVIGFDVASRSDLTADNVEQVIRALEGES